MHFLDWKSLEVTVAPTAGPNGTFMLTQDAVDPCLWTCEVACSGQVKWYDASADTKYSCDAMYLDETWNITKFEVQVEKSSSNYWRVRGLWYIDGSYGGLDYVWAFLDSNVFTTSQDCETAKAAANEFDDCVTPTTCWPGAEAGYFIAVDGGVTLTPQ